MNPKIHNLRGSMLRFLLNAGPIIFLLWLISIGGVSQFLSPETRRMIMWVPLLCGLGLCGWLGWRWWQGRKAGNRFQTRVARAGLIAFGVATSSAASMLMTFYRTPQQSRFGDDFVDRALLVIAEAGAGVFFFVGVGILMFASTRARRPQ